MDMHTKALSPAEIARIEARSAPAPAITFVGTGTREFTVDLEFPVEVDGAVIQRVTIRRPSMREWRAYLRACADAVKVHGPGADDLVDQAWLSIPAAVLEELDFTDASRVEAAMEGFFGRSSLPEGTAEVTGSS